MQSRKGSLTESIISTAVGFVLTMIANMIIFPLYDIKITTVQNLQIVAMFTIISIVRQYILRRIFNNYTIRRINDV